MQVVRGDVSRLDDVGRPRAPPPALPVAARDALGGDGERGRGVGRALIDAAFDVMRELGAAEVMLYVMDGNDGAIRFDERLGLEPYLHVLLGRVPNHPRF